MVASIAFWMSNAGIPILTFLLNMGTRLFKQLPISAGADWVLILLAFDFVAISNVADFTTYAVSPIFRESLPSVLVGMIILGFLFWIYCVFKLEPALDNIRIKKKVWGWSELIQIIIATSLVCLDTWAHFSLFSFHKIL